MHSQLNPLVAQEHIADLRAAADRYRRAPSVAEVAIKVSDALHHQGIGTTLVLRTLERAGANGFTRVAALTLRDNAAASGLLRLLHFVRGSSRSPNRVRN